DMGAGARLSMVTVLELAFPRLRPGSYQITSAPTNRYNCIAWAANDVAQWWWPVGEARYFWPAGVRREETISAFEAAFATLGFQVCDSGEPEAGSEKVAVFADPQGVPTHAARQLPGGRWTSKLGEADDIDHELTDLEGDV